MMGDTKHEALRGTTLSHMSQTRGVSEGVMMSEGKELVSGMHLLGRYGRKCKVVAGAAQGVFAIASDSALQDWRGEGSGCP